MNVNLNTLDQFKVSTENYLFDYVSSFYFLLFQCTKIFNWLDPNSNCLTLRKVNSILIITFFSERSTMSSHQEDFFSEPNWPQLSPLHRPLSHLECNQHNQDSHMNEIPVKNNFMEHTFNIYLAQQQLQQPHELPSEYVKQEQELNSDPFVYFQHHDKSQSLVNIKDSSLLDDLSVEPAIKPEEEEEDDFSAQSEELRIKMNQLSGKKKQRSKYTILDKNIKSFLVRQTEFLTLSQLSKAYGVSINNIVRWKKTLQRKKGAGRKVVDSDLESKMVNWIQEEIFSNNNGKNLTRMSVRRKAKEWANCQNFKGSKGWLERFVKRNKALGLHEILRMRLKTLDSDDSEIESTKMGCPSYRYNHKNRHSARLRNQSSSTKQFYC